MDIVIISFMESAKQQLITDIENLLNTYQDVKPTYINPKLLEFLDTDTLKQIIHSLLNQQEKCNDDNIEWLEQFKKH